MGVAYARGVQVGDPGRHEWIGVIRMTMRSALVLAATVLGLGLVFGVPVAAAGNGDVICGGVAPPSVPHDLIVNGFCLDNGSRIGHDVLLGPGASYIKQGGSVGHDIIAHDATAVLILGGATGQTTVGHDISLDDSVLDNLLCGTRVGHDLSITGGLGTVIGDFDGPGQCGLFAGGVFVTHDLVVVNNGGGGVAIEDNNPATNGGVGHDLVALNNPGQVVESNTIGRDATCDPPAGKDGDGTPNTVGRNNNGCG